MGRVVAPGCSSLGSNNRPATGVTPKLRKKPDDTNAALICSGVSPARTPVPDSHEPIEENARFMSERSQKFASESDT